MRTNEIINEINKLPIAQRIYVVERAIRSIRAQENKSIMEKAADILSVDYNTDMELTAFTNIDFENFYEAK